MGNAGTSTRETERKYEVDGPVPAGSRGGPLGEVMTAPPEEQQLSARYFDTEELGLLRSGVTLRRREGGHDEGWHLKLPAGPDTREEIRLPLTAGRTTPPAEFVSLTRLYARGRELRPVAELDTERRRWLVHDADGHEMAELVEDQVTAHTLGAQTTAVSWREVEVELGEHGRPELLDRIERDLLAHGARRARSSVKLGRVLTAPEEPRARVKAGSAGAVLLDYLRAQAETLRSLDPMVRRDAPDAVHQMRVASRRMRSGLQAFRGVLDRDATADLIEELRWLGRELTDARDAEVIEEELLGEVEALPEELVLGSVSAHLTRIMQRRRADGQARALAALDSDRYLRLHDAIDRLLADPPLTRRARRPARRELATGVAKAWRRILGHMRGVRRTEPGPARDTELHEARKAAKRLRYAVEAAQPAVGKPADRLRKSLKGLNSVLGEHQDAVVARPVIRDLAVQAHLDGGNGFTFGVLHGEQRVRALRAEQRIDDAWRRLRKGKALAWVER